MDETTKIKWTRRIIFLLIGFLLGIVVVGISRIVFGAYGEIQPDSDRIVGLWHLNDNDASEDDSSGNGNGCSITGATFVTNARIGGGYYIDTVEELACGPGTGIDNVFRGTFTIMWWSKNVQQSSSDDYFDKGSKFHISATSNSNDDVRVFTDYGSGDSNQTKWNNIMTADSTWRHIAITATGNDNSSGTEQKLYLNSILQPVVYYVGTTATQSESDAATSFNIGGRGTGSGFEMDEVIIFDEVLTQAEITKYYSLQKGGYGVN